MHKMKNNIAKDNKILKMYTGGTNHNRRTLNEGDVYKISGIMQQVPLISQPICEHCERIGIWDWDIDMWGQLRPLCQCETCGTITKHPMTYGEYLANGYDIPITVVGKDREDSILARKLLNMLMNVDGKDGRDEILKQ